MFFSSLNQHYDIIICVYWFKLISQVSDVAHGPLVMKIKEKRKWKKKSRKSYRCSPCNICIYYMYTFIVWGWPKYIYRSYEKISGSMFILVPLGLVVPFRNHIWREEHHFPEFGHDFLQDESTFCPQTIYLTYATYVNVT